MFCANIISQVSMAAVQIQVSGFPQWDNKEFGATIISVDHEPSLYFVSKDGKAKFLITATLLKQYSIDSLNLLIAFNQNKISEIICYPREQTTKSGELCEYLRIE
jgi:hypothetical protein